MEVIKRKISFEDATVRSTGGTEPYGTMTADTFYIKIMLTQNIDNIGLMTDITFDELSISDGSPDYSILTKKLESEGYDFPFMNGTPPQTPTELIDTTTIRVTGKELEDYWSYGSKITGATDSKLIDVRSYDNTMEYIVGFDVDKTEYENYAEVLIDGRTRVTGIDEVKQSNYEGELLSGVTTYVYDTNYDSNIGTSNQTTGILYKDFLSGSSRTIPNYFGGIDTIPLTEMEYVGEGWNMTNTSLSAQTKEEYLFGITQPPEVLSDVFIERGSTTVFEKHLRLSEVDSLEHLEKYNNSFYKLVKQ
jgi:hypothetical protein